MTVQTRVDIEYDGMIKYTLQYGRRAGGDGPPGPGDPAAQRKRQAVPRVRRVHPPDQPGRLVCRNRGGLDDQPVPGADDGGSGVAVLLELARVLQVSGTNKQVWLVFFDAEDNGDLDGWPWLVGSRYFAEHLSITPTAVVIVDMVGDMQQDIYLERNSNQALAGRIWDVAQKLGYGSQFIRQLKWDMVDDHTPFLQKGLPAVDIIDFDYPYWHTVQDTPDKISADSLERVGRTLQVWLESRSQPDTGYTSCKEQIRSTQHDCTFTTHVSRQTLRVC